MARWTARLAAAAALSLAACAGAPPPKDPPLTADPPLGGGVGPTEAASQTEVQRGIAFLKNEKYEDARTHFELALSTQPKNAEASYYLGVCKEKGGDRAGAEAAYKDALAANPGLVEAAGNLSALYLDDPPRPDEAVAVLKDALAKTPGDVTLLRNLAYAYTLKHDVENASRQYDAALAKGDSVDLRFAYGTMLFENKQPGKAAEQLEKALAGTGDDAAMLVTLGRMLGGAGAFGRCVEAFDRALKLKAIDPEWFVRRGTCRHEIKDDAGAEADYQQAIKVDPKFAPGHYYLGLAYLVEKKRAAALAELDKAVKLGGDSKIGKAAKDRLDELGTGKRH
jgi:Flp pilus assembly protein TadD